MKYREALKELTSIEEQIENLTQIYVKLMNKDFKGVTFSLNLEMEKVEKAEIDTEGYSGSLLSYQSIFTGMMIDRHSNKFNSDNLNTKFSIDPDIAMYVCQLEIQRLVEVRNGLATLINPKYKLPSK